MYVCYAIYSMWCDVKGVEGGKRRRRNEEGTNVLAAALESEMGAWMKQDGNFEHFFVFRT